MKTLKSLVEKSHINEKLIRAVVRQIGGWESFTQSAPDITNHGIDGGFHGFIYTAETVKFAKKNLPEIMELAKNMADEIGENKYKMVEGFNCLKDYENLDAAEAIYNKKSEDHETVLNALAWFAGEEVARSYVDMLGEDGAK